MMQQKSKTPRKRRRTCYDRLRTRWLENRRRQRADPAASAAAQLVVLFMTLLGRIPLLPAAPVPALYVPPPVSPGQVQRNAIARRLGIPSRYLDVVLAQGAVPYSILFEHVRRGGRSRDDTMTMLRQRAPEACRDWLDHVERWGLWSSLLLCHIRNRVDEDTDVKLLKSTLAWMQDLDASGDTPGPTDARMILKPGPGGNEVNPDDDSLPPKP
jgi:hypothetical protein